MIGLEVHAQINCESKLFSSAPHKFNSAVNTNVSYFDASVPGTLPVLNRRCVEAAVETALALQSDISLTSYFDRKHYFYSDLPAGYQITQQRLPLARGGQLQFPLLETELPGGPGQRVSKVEQLQLEQDSGKSLHDEDRSLVDLNRCGAGLMEIVFQPDLRHGEEAAALVQELVLVLRALGSSLARMERGELRVDANISVRRPGGPLGTRTEVKNINSARSVARAVEHEVARQVGLLERGGTVETETRSFDYVERVTVGMREKEAGGQDYRFMPEPNLPPLRLSDGPAPDPHQLDISPLRERLPELPAALRARLVTQHGLTALLAAQLVQWPNLLQYFLACSACSPANSSQVANIIFSSVHEHCNTVGLTPLQCSLRPAALVEVSNLRQEAEISASGLQEVVQRLLQGDTRTASQIVQEEGLIMIRNSEYIEQFAQDVLQAQPDLVTKFRKETKPKKSKRIYQSLMSEVNRDSRAERVDMVIFAKIFNRLLSDNK